MLNTSARHHTLSEAFAVWVDRFRAYIHRITAPTPTPAYTAPVLTAATHPQSYMGVPRRYPIPPEKAHLYARAADEGI